MKKVIVSFVFIALLAIGFSSCKSHERCPAYGKIDNTELEDKA